MDIAALINRVGGTRRRFAGAFFISAYPVRGSAFRGEVELLRGDTDVYFEGGYLCEGEKIPEHFKLSIPFTGLHTGGGTAVLTTAITKELKGTILSTANGFEFLGRSQQTTCALHLHFTGRESFTVSGMTELKTHLVAFSAEPETQWERSAEAKVVGLHSRLRRS